MPSEGESINDPGWFIVLIHQRPLFLTSHFCRQHPRPPRQRDQRAAWALSRQYQEHAHARPLESSLQRGVEVRVAVGDDQDPPLAMGQLTQVNLSESNLVSFCV